MTKQPPPRTYFSGCFKLLSSGPPVPPPDTSGTLAEQEDTAAPRERSIYHVSDSVHP